MAASIQLTDAQWSEVEQIDGWLYREEADLLYELCDGLWCEIGSWKGKSTIVLAQKHFGYAVDWFRGSPEHAEGTNTLAAYLRNTSRYEDNIKTIPLRMEEAAEFVPNDLQMLFLDGEHTYNATKAAFELYAPKVKKDGIIILHDVWDEEGDMESLGPWPEVNKYAQELIKQGEWQNTQNVMRSAVFEKK